MKLIMTVILMLSFAITGIAFLAQAQAIARSVTIVSGIADMRTADNLTECQQVESHASQKLCKIQDSFIPIKWLGGLTVLCGLAGLITVCRKQPIGADNNTSETVRTASPKEAQGNRWRVENG